MINIIGNGIFCNFFNHKKYQKSLNDKTTFLSYLENGGIQWTDSRNNFINKCEKDGYQNPDNSHRLFFKNSFSTMYVKHMMFGNKELILPKTVEKVLQKEQDQWVWKIVKITNQKINWFENNDFIVIALNKSQNLAYKISTKIVRDFIYFDYQKIAYQQVCETGIEINVIEKTKIINWIKYALLIMNTVYEFYRHTYFHNLTNYQSFPATLQKQWNNYQSKFLNYQDAIFSFNYFPEVIGHLNNNIINNYQGHSKMIHGYLNQQEFVDLNMHKNSWLSNCVDYQLLINKIKNSPSDVVEVNLFALNPKHDQPLFYKINTTIITSGKKLIINYYYYHKSEIPKIKALINKVGINLKTLNFINSNLIWKS